MGFWLGSWAYVDFGKNRGSHKMHWDLVQHIGLTFDHFL